HPPTHHTYLPTYLPTYTLHSSKHATATTPLTTTTTTSRTTTSPTTTSTTTYTRIKDLEKENKCNTNTNTNSNNLTRWLSNGPCVSSLFCCDDGAWLHVLTNTTINSVVVLLLGVSEVVHSLRALRRHRVLRQFTRLGLSARHG
uniref:GP46-like surface antigen n=1 Tax=Mesocestoides corti TaxID=53468 RepID=A0A5K3G188_MESCO